MVARTARAFSRSGGDLRRTLEALLLGGDELLEARLVKVKTPFELVASAIRATGAELRHPLGSLRVLRELGQLPYLAPTPEGYPDVATRWIDPGSVLARTRFAFALAGEQIPGLRLDEVSTPDPRSLPAGPLGASTRRALAEPGLAGRERLAVALASPEFQLR